MNEYEIHLIGTIYPSGGSAYAYQVNGAAPVIKFSLFHFDSDTLELIALHDALSSLPSDSKAFAHLRMDLCKKFAYKSYIVQDNQPSGWEPFMMINNIDLLCWYSSINLVTLVSEYDCKNASPRSSKPEALLLQAIQDKADSFIDFLPAYGFAGFEHLALEVMPGTVEFTTETEALAYVD
jgi:hypothetical protein